MPKESWKALPLAAGLLLIGLVLGCPTQRSDAPVPGGPLSQATGAAPRRPDPKGTAPAGDHQPARSALPTPKPMLQGWPKPALAIVLSGDQHGYMEPCGCTLTQSGGLSRRADFFRQLHAKGWAVTALDVGGLVRKENQQNRLKFQVMLNALKELGYKALAIGVEELGFEHAEPGFLITQGPPAGSDADGFSFVNANLTFNLFKDAGAVVAVPTKIVTVAGHKIGVTAVLGENLAARVLGSSDPQIAVKEPQAALPGAVEALKKQGAEILVLLAHTNREDATKLAKKFPTLDLVVTPGPEDGNDRPQRFGKTLLLEVGQKGKHIAIVGYYPENRKEPFRFELVDLDKERFHDTPKMLDHLREYVGMVEANYDAVMQDLPKGPHPSGDHYAGVETCKDCHKKAYAVWIDSNHAHAFESLITGREGAKNPIRRDRDPECLACHVTGWEPQEVFPYESGFYSEQKTPHLKEQQCENCHGPAASHVDLEQRRKKDPKAVAKKDLDAARSRLKLTVAIAEKNLCFRCHDWDNDPNFNFEKYWEQIKHPGKD
jgi:Cytochrome c554 and c-prime